MGYVVVIVLSLAILFLLIFGFYKLLRYVTDMPLLSGGIALAVTVILFYLLVKYGGGLLFLALLYHYLVGS